MGADMVDVCRTRIAAEDQAEPAPRIFGELQQPKRPPLSGVIERMGAHGAKCALESSKSSTPRLRSSTTSPVVEDSSSIQRTVVDVPSRARMPSMLVSGLRRRRWFRCGSCLGPVPRRPCRAGPVTLGTDDPPPPPRVDEKTARTYDAHGQAARFEDTRGSDPMFVEGRARAEVKAALRTPAATRAWRQ